ncbi:MAG: ABC transporter permease [Thermoplasmata archaeon]|nr:ABC transporter permease [Thermoplasmata archaeon]
MLRRICAIARNSVKEEVRKKTLYILVIFAVGFILSSGAISRVRVGHEGRAVVEMGLFGIGLFGMLIAIFLTAPVLFSEMKQRTIYVLLSYPLRTCELLVGKVLGVMGVLLIAVALMGLSLIGYVGFRFQVFDWLVVKGIVLIFFQLTLLCALVLMFATFLSRITNIIISMIFFYLGSSHSLLGDLTGAITNPIVKGYVNAFIWILPNFEKFSIRERMFEPDFVLSTGLFLGFVGEAVLRSAVILLLAILFFNIREVGSEQWA